MHSYPSDIPDDRHGKPFAQFKALADNVLVAATVRVGCRELVDKATLYSSVEAATGDLILQMASYVHAMPKERITIFKQWPADWWQAFRERWFPKWWLRRWPVRYETIDIDRTLYGRVCPHIAQPKSGPHLVWLARGIGEE